MKKNKKIQIVKIYSKSIDNLLVYTGLNIISKKVKKIISATSASGVTLTNIDIKVVMKMIRF